MAAHRVAIVGGGFGGLFAAKELDRADVDVTLIDRTNHHLFQPLLYQVATGILSEGSVAPPLRDILRRQRNTEVVLGEVVGVDLDARCLTVDTFGRRSDVAYDSLIVAAGAEEPRPGARALGGRVSRTWPRRTRHHRAAGLRAWRARSRRTQMKSQHLSWVVTTYLLSSTVVGPLDGKLGDLYGRKRLLQGAHLPPAIHALYVAAVCVALHPVFLTAAGVIVGGFGLSLLLRDVPLRETAGAAGIGESFAAPREAGSENELERVPAPSSMTMAPISSESRRRARAGAA